MRGCDREMQLFPTWLFDTLLSESKADSVDICRHINNKQYSINIKICVCVCVCVCVCTHSKWCMSIGRESVCVYVCVCCNVRL